MGYNFFYQKHGWWYSEKSILALKYFGAIINKHNIRFRYVTETTCNKKVNDQCNILVSYFDRIIPVNLNLLILSLVILLLILFT